MTDQPTTTGRDHWLEAERLLTEASEPSLSSYAVGALVARAAVHAALAHAAPAYGWHVPPRNVIADSPNITPGINEGPRCCTEGFHDDCCAGIWCFACDHPDHPSRHP